ncbi:GNAT family N-acetyltransferase [Shewanella sp. OMA3-2]|uniref:GNAT family N-acetyltransferase n=1 Tax=Shewanella sp. OMA3-2 TaxID=2908650 RepID=UPI001F346A43|nr:GNAT family N-acetyltransferase [Shewanella sp. OMA3-2]UJF23262.1 GNAT family N-acetyltransferase [Shewanella sp. OMA3-2]
MSPFVVIVGENNVDIALYSDRLIIRSLQPKDWNNFLAINQDPQVNQFVREPTTELVLHTKFEASLLPWCIESGEWLTLLIETIDGEFVGLTGFYCQDFYSKRVEVGYLLSASMQGMGYGSESLRAVVDWGRLQFDIHKYVAVCAQANLPSINVLQKVGFILEGTFLQHTYLAGKWIDDYQFGLVLSTA